MKGCVRDAEQRCGTTTPGAVSQAQARLNRLALALSLAAMLFGIFWLVWILWETLRLGIGGFSFGLLTRTTPPPNDAGGLANAIFGSLVMVALATGWAHR